MQIQVNTDHNIKGHETLVAEISSTVEGALSHFSEHITRVEVHISDENSKKTGAIHDIRCLMEARLEGRQPVAITNHGGSIDQAVDGAANKLARLVDSTIGRLRGQHHHAADPLPTAIEEPDTE